MFAFLGFPVNWPSPGFNLYFNFHLHFTLLTPFQALLGSISGCFSQHMMLHFQCAILVCRFFVLPCSPDKLTTACMTALSFIAKMYLGQPILLTVFFSSNGTFVNGEKIGKVFLFLLSIWIYCTSKLIVIPSFRQFYGTSTRQCFLKLMIICNLELNFSHCILLQLTNGMIPKKDKCFKLHFFSTSAW